MAKRQQLDFSPLVAALAKAKEDKRAEERLALDKQVAKSVGKAEAAKPLVPPAPPPAPPPTQPVGAVKNFAVSPASVPQISPPNLMGGGVRQMGGGMMPPTPNSRENFEAMAMGAPPPDASIAGPAPTMPGAAMPDRLRLLKGLGYGR